jgi:glycosyltransferase involved in cell wall biosynthesis
VDEYPLVSIIIPVFNRFNEANRAIRSVLDQTWKHWELFVIDDCSDNNYTLPDDCNGFEQSIVLYRNINNIGPGLSRQIGVEKTCGEFVCFLDSDDFYSPFFLEKSIKKLILNDDYSATFTNSQYVQNSNTRGSDDVHIDNIMPSLFRFQRPWTTCSWLWRRKYIAKWKALRTNQDSLFEIDCSILNNKIIHVPEFLCYIDKGTGLNSADLVDSVESNKDRNYVARYAYKNRSRIDFGVYDKKTARNIILERIRYTGVKMIQKSNFAFTFRSALILIRFYPFTGVSLLIISFLCVLPSDKCSQILNRLMNRILFNNKMISH